MKKAISILLILCLMITMAGAALAEDTLVYESSFAAGNDDWFARGAQSVKNTPEMRNQKPLSFHRVREEKKNIVSTSSRPAKASAVPMCSLVPPLGTTI